MKMIEVDFRSIPFKDAYKFLIGGVVPRPIAWVSTISSKGVSNLAPFSFFNAVCSNPPSLLFCPANHPDGRQKDTLRNCQETKQFVVNMATEGNALLMNESSAPFPPEISEFEALGIESLPSKLIKPPRVKDSPLHFECEVLQIIQVGDGTDGSGNVVIGKILCAHINDEAYENGRIKIEKLKPIARVAGNAYAPVREIFTLERPIITSK